MKKILFLFIAVIFFTGSTFAAENYVDENITPEDFAVRQEAGRSDVIVREQTIQERINDVAFKILNANKNPSFENEEQIYIKLTDKNFALNHIFSKA